MGRNKVTRSNHTKFTRKQKASVVLTLIEQTKGLKNGRRKLKISLVDKCEKTHKLKHECIRG
jgi:hypothetical protein